MDAIQILKQRVLELRMNIDETTLRIERREEQTKQDKAFLHDIKTALASCESAIEKLESK